MRRRVRWARTNMAGAIQDIKLFVEYLLGGEIYHDKVAIVQCPSTRDDDKTGKDRLQERSRSKRT